MTRLLVTATLGLATGCCDAMLCDCFVTLDVEGPGAARAGAWTVRLKGESTDHSCTFRIAAARPTDATSGTWLPCSADTGSGSSPIELRFTTQGALRGVRAASVWAEGPVQLVFTVDDAVVYDERHRPRFSEPCGAASGPCRPLGCGDAAPILVRL